MKRWRSFTLGFLGGVPLTLALTAAHHDQIWLGRGLLLVGMLVVMVSAYLDGVSERPIQVARQQHEKYRLAWLSARRRAASERRMVESLDQALMPLERRAERYRLAWHSARWRARSYVEEFPPSKPCPCAACELARADNHRWGDE